MSEPLPTDWKSLPRPVATAGSVIVRRCPTCGGFEGILIVQRSFAPQLKARNRVEH